MRARPVAGPAGTGEDSSGRVTRASAHSDARAQHNRTTGPAMALYGAAVDDMTDARGKREGNRVLLISSMRPRLASMLYVNRD